MRRHLLIIGFGILVGLFLHFLLSAELEEAGLLHKLPFTWACWGTVLAYAVFHTSRLLDQQMDWHQQAGLRWLLGWLSNSVLALAMGWIGLRLLAVYYEAAIFEDDTSFSFLLKAGLILFFLVLVYTVVYFALYSYQYYGRVKVAEVRKEREQIDLQWQALRNQLQPHFLFNSLNTISALIHEDEKRAEAFIRRLAHAYQYTLQSYDKTLVDLSDEMRFVRSYYFLLKTRFADCLDLKIDIAQSSAGLKVPPLGVQLLVENAIKHNQISSDSCLNIHITADDSWLWVANNKMAKQSKNTSFSIGLNNLRARYELLSDRKLEVGNTDQFIVKIPLLR